MKYTILTIRDGQCRFPVTDGLPHMFCGEVTALDRVYCDEHHARCHNGFGKHVGALELMIYTNDHSVIRDSTHPVRGTKTQPVDVVIGDDK